MHKVNPQMSMKFIFEKFGKTISMIGARNAQKLKMYKVKTFWI